MTLNKFVILNEIERVLFKLYYIIVDICNYISDIYICTIIDICDCISDFIQIELN